MKANKWQELIEWKPVEDLIYTCDEKEYTLKGKEAEHIVALVIHLPDGEFFSGFMNPKTDFLAVKRSDPSPSISIAMAKAKVLTDKYARDAVNVAAEMRKAIEI